MLKNYLKIALRNLRKHAGYTVINILGLAIGMTCCVLIALYVWDELAFDRFHDDADQIYRLRVERYSSGGESELTRDGLCADGSGALARFSAGRACRAALVAHLPRRARRPAVLRRGLLLDRFNLLRCLLIQAAAWRPGDSPHGPLFCGADRGDGREVFWPI